MKEPNNERTKLVVYNEYCLGYIYPQQLNIVNILRTSILKGAPISDTWYYLIGSNDTIRLANLNDFQKYKILFEGFNNSEKYEFAMN